MKLFSLFLIILTVIASDIRAQVGAVTAELTLDQDQFLAGEDVRVAVRVTNRSGQSLQLGTEDDWITFSVQGSDQYIVKQLGEVPMASEFTLESSKTGIRRANLTPYFNFQQPGRYQITASVKIPQWGKEISSTPVSFDVIAGTVLKELDFGVPTMATNRAPEMRKYVLQQAIFLKSWKLYFRLTDSRGSTLRIYPVAPMTSFSQPEAQIDQKSNLHVLHQTGARAFNYCMINPDGEIVTRQIHDYSTTRPVLRLNADGKIYVAGGVQRVNSTASQKGLNNQSPEKNAPTQKP